MSFWGIPIDGDVDSFCMKLQSKGLKKNEEGTSSIKSYIGNFFGEEAYFDVYYDNVSKYVYEVSVSIIKNNAIEIYPIARDIVHTIEEKYKYTKEEKNPSISQYDYYIYKEDLPVGLIQTYVLDMDKLGRVGESMFSISYIDIDNYLKFEGRKRNDI